MPTHNSIKVINWLYICSAILKYTEFLCKNTANLSTQKDLTLKTILTHVYEGPLAMYLNNYVTSRKMNRKSDEEHGDNTGATEIHSENTGGILYSDINERRM